VSEKSHATEELVGYVLYRQMHR